MKLPVAVVAAGLSLAAQAEADGPDHYRLKAGAATLRAEPKAGAPAVAPLPAGATCLRNRGCEGGLTFQEFQALAPAERARRERERPRWCLVEYRGYSGWVEGSRLAEDGCPAPAKPSFDCRKAAAGSIEALVCGDGKLTALDRRLADVYAAATKRAAGERPPQLKATQRGWVRGRDDCWKEADKSTCVADAYVRRIVELQARYRLAPYTAPVRFACAGEGGGEVVVTYFRTEPGSLVAVRGEETSLMLQQPTASGTHYVGRNESIREHQGEARVTWGYGAKELACRPRG